MSNSGNRFNLLSINERKMLRIQRENNIITEVDKSREDSLASRGYASSQTSAANRKTLGHQLSLYHPQSQRTIQESNQKKVSFLRKFFQSLGCCYQETEIQDNASSEQKSQMSSFARSSNGNNAVHSSLGEQDSRQSSNSSTWLFNILQYPQSGFSALKLGHFGFLQIPVKFQRVDCGTSNSVYDMVAKHILSSNEMPHTLIVEEYLDSDLAVSFSKYSSFALCVFSSPMISINPNLQITKKEGQGSLQSSARENHSDQESAISNKQLQKVDFLKCLNFSMAIYQDQFEKTIVVPTSLIQQGNAFDVNFQMHPEFKYRFLELLNEFQFQLDKTIFILPKYCRIREIMILIYESFVKSSLTIQDLNFGIQFHSFFNAQQDVEAIALVFDSDQNEDTLAAISHRVFSNISPEINSKRNSLLPIKIVPQQFSKSKNSLQVTSSLQSVENRNSYSLPLPKVKKSNAGESFVAVEEEENDPKANTQLQNQIISPPLDLKDNSVMDFGQIDYIEEISKCQFKQLYNFLKEINACFIIHQENTFYYRTHIIDMMLKHSIIQGSFIPLLLHDIQEFDQLFKPPKSVHNTPQLGAQKDTKRMSKTQLKELAQPTNFKDYYFKNSKQYIPMYPIPLDTVMEKDITKEQSLRGSRQESETTDITTTSQIPFNLKNGQKSPVESSHNISQNQNHSTQSQDSISSLGIIQPKAGDQKSVIEQVRNRMKQSSCNIYTTSMNNRHIGFKQKKRFQSIVLEGDIINHTLANRIVDSNDPKDKKFMEDLKKWQIDKSMEGLEKK